jgi:hypothetical protein
VTPEFDDLVEHQPQGCADFTAAIHQRLKWQSSVIVASRSNHGFSNFHGNDIFKLLWM